MLTFEPREGNHLLCVGSNGVVVGWADVWAEQPKLAIR